MTEVHEVPGALSDTIGTVDHHARSYPGPLEITDAVVGDDNDEEDQYEKEESKAAVDDRSSVVHASFLSVGENTMIFTFSAVAVVAGVDVWCS